MAAVWPDGDGSVVALDKNVYLVRAHFPARESQPPLIARGLGGSTYGLRADYDDRPLPLCAGPIEVDPDTGETRVNGLQLAMGDREHTMLATLLPACGRPVGRAALCEAMGIPPGAATNSSPRSVRA